VEFDNIQDKEPQQLDNQILTLFQLEKFQKIFAQHTIKESNEEQEINKQLTILLDQQEKDAFFLKLSTFVCCKNKMCLTKIDHELAFQIFDRMLYAMVRSNETLHSKEKQYLTVKYTFDNDEICEKAFQTIYLLTEKKWKNIRNYYRAN
ncbi:2834_t:CDS:2, partial [Racocetra persica]